MKEATGELNMTVITIIAIVAVGTLFYVFLWPVIQTSIATQTCRTYGADWTAVPGDTVNTGSNAIVAEWMCCPPNQTTAPPCVAAQPIGEEENQGTTP